ncbi:ABC transporter ATP-binding protein [Alphaproteobacteria bacterium]|nr:ABC transporter ATP-binding protein [Alphaproteobacteria bacterium]
MIKLSNVSLDYPIVGIGSHSLQLEIYSKLGGVLKADKRQKYVRAISNLSLSIMEGQRLGIVGHNGAGKTTLLRIMSGVYAPTSGGISLEGNVSAMTDFTLGMDPNVSGLENIYFRLQFMGYKKSDIDALIPEIVDFSGLGEFINMPARSYSTGMYMRLAFAISTSFKPDILICDEIIGAGDFEFQEKAQERLERVINDSRILVLSSHDLGAIAKFCNRVIVMEKGQIMFDGCTEDALTYYTRPH